MTETYYYSVVKLVPHPVRDEPINLGVVLTSGTGDYADYRFTRAFKTKIRALAPDVPPAFVERFIAEFPALLPRVKEQQMFSGLTPLEPRVETLDRLAEQHAYQIRFTPPRPAIGDPERLLQELFEEYVAPIRLAEPEPVGRSAVRTRIVRALHQWHIPRQQIVEAPRLPVRHGVNSLDLGIRRSVSNGLAVAMEPLSFSIEAQPDIVRQRDHIAWVVTDLREDVERPTICAVASTPLPANKQLLDETIELFKDLRVEVIPVEKLEQLRVLLATAGVEGLEA